jgi:outer membrane protein OmpA-like peptidoglycan-associated protein
MGRPLAAHRHGRPAKGIIPGAVTAPTPPGNEEGVMAANLVDLVKGYLGPDVVQGMGAYIGEPTPATQKALGAIVPTLIFEDLNFETGSTRLTPSSATTVDSLAAILKAYPAVAVALEGHTDSTGDAVANKRLSLDRATAVRETLVKSGVDGSRITTAGHGPARPIASNDTEEGRARNRHLELIVEKR